MKANLLPLSREQYNLLLSSKPFNLLREAKRKIAEEFEQDLALHSKDVLNDVYKFSLDSKEERLLDIYNILQQHLGIEAEEFPSANHSNSIGMDVPNTDKILIGDIVDGKRCTGYYRGQPVFSED